ncbi:hypothetical protein MASR2M74_13840 [Paracoccaceae bacterium]
MLRRMLLTSALTLLALPALARENYALLIGASTYPGLDQKYWLKGPANDVKLVQTWLTTEAPVPFAPGNVAVLADGLEGAQAPTLAAIREQMAALADKVQPGDFVYLHFSGHGTQAPAADPDSELDGLDELFLPTDIGPWSDEVSAVENGLVDDEIGRMIDALRGKGANVWAVFDSCHSGTVTRGAPDGDEEVRTRQLPPEALGLSTDALEVSTRSLDDPRAQPEAPVDAAAGSAEAGSFVAFYAAQTNEVTPEKNLPKGKPGRIPQGVFTYTLFEVLAEYPQATYGQIGQEVLRKYATKSLARSTPMFEGDLEQVAFAGTKGARVAQWAATRSDDGFTIPAGSLHGLAAGDVLAVMASAADPTDAALGYVALDTVDTFTATAKPVVQEGKTLPAELPKGLMLRKIGADLDFSLTVALPEAGSAPAEALTAAMQALTEAAGPRISFVPAGAPEADLRLAVLPVSPRPDAIWVLPETGLAEDLATTPSVSTADKDAATLGATLADTLGAMAKAMNLMKMAGAVGAEGLDVSVEMLTGPDKNNLAPMPASGVPRLIPEDQVHVLARNHMDIPVDVNVLYIGADWSISHWFSGRLQPGDTLKKGLFKISDSVLGQERMVVVMTPAAPQSPVEDLSFLAQDSLDMTREVPKGGLRSALTEAGFGQTTRAAMALDDGDADSGPGPAILQLELRTVPAP